MTQHQTGEELSLNIMLDGNMCPSQKQVRFVLFEQKTNVNKEHQLIPGIGTAILGMMGLIAVIP
jgi:hypothetical protein